MSGDKQHYIPRSLLRGFTHRVGKDGSVLVIKKDKRYVSNIAGVAAERHFYGMPGAGSLDDLITDFEGRFGKFFHDLRMQSGSAPLNARMIAKMLAHLSLRSMAIRSTQAKMMVDFLRGFEDFGASESSVGSALDQSMSDGSLRKLIRKEAGRSGQRIDERQLKELVFQARQKFRSERQDMIGGLGLMVKNGAAQMLSRVSVSVKDTQYRLLASFGERSANLIRRFEMLKWELIDFGDNDYLWLGDSPVVYLDPEGRALNVSLGEIAGAFLPISSNRLLFGRDDSVSLFKSAVEAREAVLRTSHDFIIAHPKLKSESIPVDLMGAARFEESEKWLATVAEIRDSLSRPFIRR